MDIIYLLKVLWRKKWIILSVSIVSSLAAYYFTLSLPQQFRAVSQIATGFTTNEGITVSEDHYGMRDMELNFSNLLTTLNSGVITNLLSYRLIVHDLKDPVASFRKLPVESKFKPTVAQIQLATKLFEEKLTEKNPTPLTLSGEQGNLLVSFLEAYGYGYSAIKAGLKIFRVPNTDFIQMEFVSENPNLSAFAVNSFYEEFHRNYAASKVERSGESVDFFEQLVKQKKTELDEKSETMKTFKSTNSFLNIEIEGESKLGQVADLEKDRDEINSVIYGLKLTLEKLRSDVNKGSNPSSVTNESIIRLRLQINSLNDRYISSGSSNQHFLDSLNQLRERLRIEMSKLSPGDGEKNSLTKSELASKISETEIKLAIEESKLNSVNAKLRNLQYSISGYASKEGTLTALTREVEVATTEYLDAVNRYNEARNKLLVSAGSIRQLERATPPPVPESSKRILIIGMAGFTTFIFASFVIVLLEVFDVSIKTPAQFERIVKLPLAGFLININTKKLDYNTLFSEKQADEELEVFKHFIRKVRFEIESLKAKVLLVTSTRKEAGKSFTIFSLAFVLSLVNKRVLIIDTNFKNNSLTRSLTKVPEKVKLLERKGEVDIKLVDPARKKPDIEEDNSMIMSTKYRNIFIIGNAGGNDSPEEILSGRDFNSLINTMKENFDYIILEGAALNDFSDSKELVRYVDCVIPVFSSDTTIGPLDRESIAYLKSLSEKMGGAILNNVDIKNLKI